MYRRIRKGVVMNSSSDLLQQVAALSGQKPSGKQKIEMQGFENAISGQKQFMPAGEVIAYLRSAIAYLKVLQPVGYHEEQLAQKVIDANWWLNRASALECNLLNADRLDNSAKSDRQTDAVTETIVSQAYAYRDECAKSNVFETLSRCAARATQVLLEIRRELRLEQSERTSHGAAEFSAAICASLRWYTEQLRRAELATAKHNESKLIEKAPLSKAQVRMAAAEILELAESNNLLDPDKTAELKRLVAGSS